MADDILYVDDLVPIARDMFASLPSQDAVYERPYGPNADQETYDLIMGRSKLFGRDVIMMDPADSYFNTFSHQMWNTPAYGLFARLATFEYMKANETSFEKVFSEGLVLGSFSDYLDKEAQPVPGSLGYSTPSEFMIQASCDLFGVKLERLTSYGSRVFNEVVPYKHKYYKEIAMCFTSSRVDSMFWAGKVPPPNPPPRLDDNRIAEIMKLGCVTSEDMSGSYRYFC